MADLPDSRTRALVEAGIALSSELSLDAVLQQLVETAAALTGAIRGARRDRPGGLALERFVTTGIDEATTSGSATFRAGGASSAC